MDFTIHDFDFAPVVGVLPAGHGLAIKEWREAIIRSGKGSCECEEGKSEGDEYS